MKNNRMKSELEKIANRGIPEDTNLRPDIAAKLERNPKMKTSLTRPFVAVLITVLTLIMISGAAYALGKTLGYFPGVGLVENDVGVRFFAEPASETRDGVTLTISSVFIFADHVDLTYEFKGVAPENVNIPVENAKTNQAVFCDNGKMGNARLRLPDGTVLERNTTAAYPQNRFATRPVFAAVISVQGTTMTLLVNCITGTRIGAVPGNWEVPFTLTEVPAGQVVGEPVIEVQKTSMPAATKAATEVIDTDTAQKTPNVTFTLERIAQLAAGPVFCVRFHLENPDPAVLTIYPQNAYLIDSLGQKIQLMNNSPFTQELSSEWELIPTENLPAAG